MRDCGSKLKQEEPTLYIKGNLFPHWDSPEWSRLPREAVGSAFLELFKVGWRKPQATWSDLLAAAVLSRWSHWGPPAIPSRLDKPSPFEESPESSLCHAYLLKLWCAEFDKPCSLFQSYPCKNFIYLVTSFFKPSL